MAIPFTDPTNEIGSYFPAGLRTGPSDQAFGPVTSGPSYGPANPNGRSMSYGYGPGLINANLCWYRIDPAAPTNSVINSGVAFSAINAGTSIPLQSTTTSQRGTQYFLAKNGLPGIQMDFPRAARIRFTGLGATTGTFSATISFTGIDVWGQTLVSDIVLNSVTMPLADNAVYYYTPSAFFQLIGNPVVTAWSPPASSSGAQMIIEAGNYFGLPYYLESEGNIISYAQYSVELDRVGSYISPTTYNTASGAQPKASTLNVWGASGILGNGSDNGQLTSGAQNINSYVYLGNQSGIVDGNSNDVRGMISPNEIVSAENTGPYSLVSGNDFSNEGAMEILYTVPGSDYLLYQYGQLMNTIQNGLTLLSGASWTGFGKTDVLANAAATPSLDKLIGVVPYNGSNS